MSLEKTKVVIFEVMQQFFQGATILWAEQTNTKPPLPYLTLKMNGMKRSTFPIIKENGDRFYLADTTLEVNLYTLGKPVTLKENATGNYANTAVSDLMDFFIFLDSDDMVDFLAERNVEVMLNPPVRDLTELKNEGKYRYRSMAEATITFCLDAGGKYGITEVNVSGGGTEEMANAKKETIKNADIKTGGI